MQWRIIAIIYCLFGFAHGLLCGQRLASGHDDILVAGLAMAFLVASLWLLPDPDQQKPNVTEKG